MPHAATLIFDDYYAAIMPCRLFHYAILLCLLFSRLPPLFSPCHIYIFAAYLLLPCALFFDYYERWRALLLLISPYADAAAIIDDYYAEPP